MNHKMKTNKIKVLYIAGPSRSGSTILSNILGEIDGFFNAGELIDIWDRGINGKCGCGNAMNGCNIWKKVMNASFNNAETIDLNEMIRQRDRYAHSYRLTGLSLIPGSKHRLLKDTDRYRKCLNKLYGSIQSVVGSKIIIDSSKNTGYAFLLNSLPTIDLFVVHLVRDPRATAYSWMRKKIGLWQTHPVESSLNWAMRNLSSEIFQKHLKKKYMRLRYEDFIGSPQETIKHIIKFVNETAQDLPFYGDHEVKLNVNHSIYGNPNRFQTGFLKLKLDDEWQVMKKKDQLIVGLLTWPYMIKYGYYSAFD